jgi:hypothetical protein
MWDLNISQRYRPPRPVTKITYLTFSLSEMKWVGRAGPHTQTSKTAPRGPNAQPASGKHRSFLTNTRSEMTFRDPCILQSQHALAKDSGDWVGLPGVNALANANGRQRAPSKSRDSQLCRAFGFFSPPPTQRNRFRISKPMLHTWLRRWKVAGSISDVLTGSFS